MSWEKLRRLNIPEAERARPENFGSVGDALAEQVGLKGPAPPQSEGLTSDTDSAGDTFAGLHEAMRALERTAASAGAPLDAAQEG